MKEKYSSVRVVWDEEDQSYIIEGKKNAWSPWVQLNYLPSKHFDQQKAIHKANCYKKQQVIYETS